MYSLYELNYNSKNNIRNYGEIYTPNVIVNNMLDQLPSDIWKHTSYIFLEPTCGNGNFLIEIAKRQLNAGINSNDIINNMIGFDISFDNINKCKDRLSKLLNIDVNIIKNIQVVHDSLDIINNKNSDFYKIIKNKKVIVIGNPPFAKPHSNNGNTYDTIYHLFVEAIINNINPDYFTFITPSKWMTGGKGLNDYRNFMMNLPYIKELHNFGGLREVFPDVVIPSGVSYFLIDKAYNGPCTIYNDNTKSIRYLNKYDIIIIDNIADSILTKIFPVINSVAFMCQSIGSFGLPTNFSKFELTGLKCLCKGKLYNEKTYKYVNISNIKDKTHILTKWKVCTATVNGGARNEANYGTKKIFGDIILLKPNEVCTATFLVVAYFDTEIEANNYISYMKTKFYRFILGLRAMSPTINKNKFIWIPDLKDYTRKYNDKFLYLKYHLSNNEINHIESKIETI